MTQVRLRGGEDADAVVTAKGELLALTERKTQFNPVFVPFLNETFGNAMNQNVTFGGTPEIIHNGGTSTEWTGSAVQGSWDFSTGAVITLSNGDNNDEATFTEETPATIDLSGFTALSGKTTLTTYSPITNSLDVEFDLAGIVVGNSVDLNDYIDTGLLGAQQSFAIPLTDMGLTTQSVDGFSIILGRTGGPKVALTFDDIQIEETGMPAVFRVAAPVNQIFHVTELRLGLADALAGTVTNGTMAGLSYDQILGVAALSTGIVFRRVQNRATNFSVTLRQLGDFLSTGSNLINVISDGTDTFIALLIEFPEPIILEGDPEDNFLSFTVNDNLSGLKQFTAAARGAVVL